MALGQPLPELGLSTMLLEASSHSELHSTWFGIFLVWLVSGTAILANFGRKWW